jgi:hypothetical protein
MVSFSFFGSAVVRSGPRGDRKRDAGRRGDADRRRRVALSVATVEVDVRRPPPFLSPKNDAESSCIRSRDFLEREISVC